VRAAAVAAGVVVLLGACGGAPLASPGPVDEMERARATPAANEGKALAPEQFALAEHERDLARQSRAAGDDTAAALYAERAIAAYGHALVLARLARATSDLADASKALDDAAEQAKKLSASRASLEHEADELETKVKIAREQLTPASSAPTPEREAARLVAARSLATQARLMCGAARLLSASATELGEAEGDVAKVESQLDGKERSSPTPIDAAARARARCLDVLTRTRRATGDETGQADTLLAELSASGSWAPTRDERGVVIALRGVFHGRALTAEGEAKLKELGRVAGAHPAVVVQVVVHDATPPSAADKTADQQRADAATKALLAGGAAAAKVKAELAGARAPVVDPNDAKSRARNERVEIVFIAPGS
jgi:outer membrane protein OmpA-like peptidoglycan-associated protein